jgi:hypothetical protein
MRVIQAPPPQPDAAVGAQFLKAVGAPEWRLVSEARPKRFAPADEKEFMAWMLAAQRAGKPVSVIMPQSSAGLHWWLQARLRSEVEPARLRPAPQWILDTEAEWWVLWRLASPVSSARGTELLAPIIGRAGMPAIGEPVPLPGSIVTKRIGKGLFSRVRRYRGSKSPGYRIDGNLLVPHDAPRAKAAPRDPRRLAIEIAEGQFINPGESTNGFFVTVGGSGSGKTIAVRRIAQEAAAWGVPVLVIDFHDDIELPGVRRVLLASGPASTVGINPLEIPTSADGERTLHDHVVGFCDLIGRAYPGLGHLQIDDLKRALLATYEAAGIIDSDPATWGRPAPTVVDLAAELGRMAEAVDDDGKRIAGMGKRIAGLMAVTQTLFGNPLFSRRPIISTADLLAGGLRLNLKPLGDSEKMVIAELLLRRIFEALKALGSIPQRPIDDSERFRLMVVIDEAQTLGDSRMLSILFQEVRKFGLMINVATQRASCLSDDVRSNAGCFLALKHSDAKEARTTGDSIRLKWEDLLALKPKGDGYLRVAGRETVRVQVKDV